MDNILVECGGYIAGREVLLELCRRDSLLPSGQDSESSIVFEIQNLERYGTFQSLGSL